MELLYLVLAVAVFAIIQYKKKEKKCASLKQGETNHKNQVSRKYVYSSKN